MTVTPVVASTPAANAEKIVLGTFPTVTPLPDPICRQQYVRPVLRILSVCGNRQKVFHRPSGIGHLRRFSQQYSDRGRNL
jgi:hypothetical protein